MVTNENNQTITNHVEMAQTFIKELETLLKTIDKECEILKKKLNEKPVEGIDNDHHRSLTALRKHLMKKKTILL